MTTYSRKKKALVSSWPLSDSDNATTIGFRPARRGSLTQSFSALHFNQGSTTEHRKNDVDEMADMLLASSSPNSIMIELEEVPSRSTRLAQNITVSPLVDYNKPLPALPQNFCEEVGNSFILDSTGDRTFEENEELLHNPSTSTARSSGFSKPDNSPAYTLETPAQPSPKRSPFHQRKHARILSRSELGLGPRARRRNYIRFEEEIEDEGLIDISTTSPSTVGILDMINDANNGMDVDSLMQVPINQGPIIKNDESSLPKEPGVLKKMKRAFNKLKGRKEGQPAKKKPRISEGSNLKTIFDSGKSLETRLSEESPFSDSIPLVTKVPEKYKPQSLNPAEKKLEDILSSSPEAFSTPHYKLKHARNDRKLEISRVDTDDDSDSYDSDPELLMVKKHPSPSKRNLEAFAQHVDRNINDWRVAKDKDGSTAQSSDNADFDDISNTHPSEDESMNKTDELAL